MAPLLACWAATRLPRPAHHQCLTKRKLKCLLATVWMLKVAKLDSHEYIFDCKK